MAFKIVFQYQDGGKIEVNNSKKKLTKELAEYYQKQYAKPSNDGGTVYIPPYRSCVPVPLDKFITEQMKGEEHETD